MTLARGKVCFLTMDEIVRKVRIQPNLSQTDDHLCVPALHARGIDVDFRSWKDTNTAWHDYDAVIVRSTWDYQLSPDEFRQTLRRIHAQSKKLLNPISILEWNMDKTYLQDLQKKGVTIVPSIFCEETPTPTLFQEWRDKLLGSDCYSSNEQLIIKPNVSATAGHTYRLQSFTPKLAEIFGPHRPYLVQPFVTNIVAEGEFSVFYFGGKLSHVTLKTPQSGDFRVQEEFGGHNQWIGQPDPALVATADKILQLVDCNDLLYARVDLVRIGNTQQDTGAVSPCSTPLYALMELELIEPSLYLHMDKSGQAPERFATAIAAFIDE
jgi:hypothetical protein